MYHLDDDDRRAHVEKVTLRSKARSRQPLEVRRSMAQSRKAQRKSRRRHDSDGDVVEAEGDGMDKGPGALKSNSDTNSSNSNKNGNDDDAAAPPAEPFGKWSTHFDKAVTFAVRGTTVALAQDPASDNIGHSVWDVSRAVARFLELDPWWRRELARHRRVVELGAGTAFSETGPARPVRVLNHTSSRLPPRRAGCGLVGIAAAMLGGHVTLTDLPSVIPLLARNVHAAMTSAGASGARTRAPSNTARTLILRSNVRLLGSVR